VVRSFSLYYESVKGRAVTNTVIQIDNRHWILLVPIAPRTDDVRFTHSPESEGSLETERTFQDDKELVSDYYYLGLHHPRIFVLDIPYTLLGLSHLRGSCWLDVPSVLANWKEEARTTLYDIHSGAKTV